MGFVVAGRDENFSVLRVSVCELKKRSIFIDIKACAEKKLQDGKIY
jgi:hypothetical protein